MSVQQQREVRDDQHGTNTGYNYGCRCRDCKAGRAEYQRLGRRSAPAYDKPVNRSRVITGPGVAVAACKSCKWIGTKYRRDEARLRGGGWADAAHQEQRAHVCGSTT